jgi:hypothetical protein
MFPELYSRIEEAVLARASRLFEKLEKRSDVSAKRKQELLIGSSSHLQSLLRP